MLKIKENSIYFHNKESGQSTFEFIFILFITISIIVGVLFQFNKGFSQFAQQYLGEYFQCLLDSGELPKLGSEDTEATGCDAYFQPFTFLEGRPPNDPQGSHTNAGGSNGSKNNDDENKLTPPSQKGDGSRGGDASGSSPGQGQGVRIDANLDRTQGKNPTEGDLAQNDSTGRMRYTTNNRIQTNDNNKKENVPIAENDNFVNRVLKKRQENAKDPSAANSVPEVLEGENQKTSRVEINSKPRSTANTEDEQNYSFGDYLKYLIIIIIILALLIVIGGQLASIRKSYEKQ